MKLSRLFCFFLFLEAALAKHVVETPSPSPIEERRQISTCLSPPTGTGKAQPMYNLNKNYGWFMSRALAMPGQACATNPDFKLRRNWQWSQPEQREAYIQAAKCLHQIPIDKPRTAGSRTFIDEFVATHMLQGYQVGFTGLHLHWHRIFLHLYEQALQMHCGYRNGLMYWDFSEHSNDILTDPLFSGNSSWIGGNGVLIPHGTVDVNYFEKDFSIPPGAGGGCVSDSILDGKRVRFGKPLVYENDTTKITTYPTPQYGNGSLEPDYLRYRQRCLTRDVNPEIGRILSYCHVEYDLDCGDFDCLQERLNGDATDYPYPLNLMNAARFSVGGLQLDPFTGPADPIWWLMATNFDRLWALWQGQNDDLEPRKSQLGGTHSPYKGAERRPVTLTDYLNFTGLVGNTENWVVANATSTIEGPLCYLYAGTY